MVQNRKARTCSPFTVLALFASGAQKAPPCCSETNMRGYYLLTEHNQQMETGNAFMTSRMAVIAG